MLWIIAIVLVLILVSVWNWEKVKGFISNLWSLILFIFTTGLSIAILWGLLYWIWSWIVWLYYNFSIDFKSVQIILVLLVWAVIKKITE